ncbi:MAG: DNA cytosine methyltransferase [Burkholderiales bacterium]|jgi:DNA (cytosine-5)-methyltransferase 1|nr:DNA cytosine methyltransferase [Burkholderiales bacterium]
MSSFYEFFAGGGMARLGLGEGWTCLLANDIDEKKAASYRMRFGGAHLRVCDVAALTPHELPGVADLAWASFPCQDLSLAGKGEGLAGERSGTFWPFWNLIRGLGRARRMPPLIALENVCGAITSNSGRDFAAIARALVAEGYRFGAVVVDAVHFVPQSRPRLFIVAVAQGVQLPDGVSRTDPSVLWHPRNLIEAKFALPKKAQENWVWWDMPAPPIRTTVFADLIEYDPIGVTWDCPRETQKLLAMMSPLNREKVRSAQADGRLRVGALYRRTRQGAQRAEVRFDDVAGCLRTPSGGSSRQRILVVEGQRVRSRLISPREAARLMGLPDDYDLPSNYNEAYQLAGDGLVVPAVAHLAGHVVTPIAAALERQNAVAA